MKRQKLTSTKATISCWQIVGCPQVNQLFSNLWSIMDPTKLHVQIQNVLVPKYDGEV
jgi:hypothetical protein